MQDQSKQDQSRTRRANPIRIVGGASQATANAEALRDVHMSLVRAEQNLFNLVQANHAANGHVGQAGFGFPVTTAPLGASYAAPGFAPGFAPLAIQQPGIPYAAGHGPWNGQQPSISAWSPLASGIVTAAAAPTFASGAFAPGLIATAPLATTIGSRTPACDVVDEGKQFVCLLDLPGVRAEQVELLASEHAVIITAYPEAEADVASLVQAERPTTALQRAITLPAEIQPTAVKATLSNGVLSVSLPKVHPTAGPRRVKVQGQ